MNNYKTNWFVITGTSSSGKTTLINKLKKRGFQTIPEMARIYIDNELAKGNTIQFLHKDELAFQQTILQMKINRNKSLSKKKLIFFDRGIPDSAAYYELKNLQDDGYLENAIKNSNYAKIFLLDPVEYEKDYARTETDEERIKLHNKLKEVYLRYGFDVVNVPVFETKDKRVDFVLQIALSSI